MMAVLTSHVTELSLETTAFHLAIPSHEIAPLVVLWSLSHV